MKRARLVDVAKAAGVSVGAASDALAGKNRIAEATRDRIQEAAARLGYVPNAAARALGSGHLPIIGLVIEGLDGSAKFAPEREYWAEVTGSASVVLARRGYVLAVLPDLEGSAPAAVPFAGIVLLSGTDEGSGIVRAREAGLPLLDLRRAKGPTPDSVGGGPGVASPAQLAVASLTEFVDSLGTGLRATADRDRGGDGRL